MNYQAVVLNFKGLVHFGEGMLSQSAIGFCADTLFSALCHEASKLGLIEALITAVKNRLLFFSDAFPYDKDALYVPRPLLKVQGASAQDPAQRKIYRKLAYVPLKELNSFLQGNFDPNQAKEINFGKKVTTTHNAQYYDGEESVSYTIGSFSFNEGCGLYFICGFKDTAEQSLLFTLLSSLALSGIGGKRTLGMGQFEFKLQDLTPYEERLKAGVEDNSAPKPDPTYMLLNVALPQENELDASLEGASFLMQKRSGFVSSPIVQQEPLFKKQDLYVFKAGSCFKHGFKGSLVNVAQGLSHTVYRYAQPLFLEI